MPTRTHKSDKISSNIEYPLKLLIPISDGIFVYKTRYLAIQYCVPVQTEKLNGVFSWMFAF